MVLDSAAMAGLFSEDMNMKVASLMLILLLLFTLVCISHPCPRPCCTVPLLQRLNATVCPRGLSTAASGWNIGSIHRSITP